MRYGVPSLGILLILLFSVRAADAPAKDEAPDHSVDKALAYLQSEQNPDGSWSLGPRGVGQHSPGVTSLCVMAFLSAGHTPGEGRYGPAVEKGIRWVLHAQRENGLLALDGQEMYNHGICTLMLAEAAGMTDGKLGEEVRAKLVKAVKIILLAQRKPNAQGRGGWHYTVRDVGDGSDMSCTGWQIMALRAAKNVGCDVPSKNIDEAVAYIKQCRDENTGGFCYQPHSSLSEPCTGTAILALELCGKNEHRSAEAIRAGNFLIKSPPTWNDRPYFRVRSEFGFYGLYYCSQAMFQLGGNYWEFYRPVVREMLFKNQKANGSWTGGGTDGSQGGPNYSTAMCVLALTVEYRYLPIYQRGEEPTDK